MTIKMQEKFIRLMRELANAEPRPLKSAPVRLADLATRAQILLDEYKQVM